MAKASRSGKTRRSGNSSGGAAPGRGGRDGVSGRGAAERRPKGPAAAGAARAARGPKGKASKTHFDRPTKGEKSAPRRAGGAKGLRKPKAPAGVAGRDASGAGLRFAVEAARLLSDLKCTEVLVLDVRGKSGVADYLVVGSGTSDRQMRSAGDAVSELGAGMDHPAFRSDADTRSTWLVIDCVDVVVHLFEPTTREYYDIETLWGDAPRLPWERGKGEVAPALAARRSVRRDESTGSGMPDGAGSGSSV